MDKLKNQVIAWVNENESRFYKISDAIWEKPELSTQEYFASQLLSDFLAGEGYTVTKGIAGLPTAFAASYGSKGPVIAFTCEYDALPALSQDKDKIEQCSLSDGAPGHGCGHNLMAIGGAMAATALKQLIDSGTLNVRLKIFGTPAEELCIGKPAIARNGFLNDVDCLLDWHPMPYNKAGYNESTAYFNCKYHFKGQTSHGHAPWCGKSALDAAILMGNTLEFLREHLIPGAPGKETTLNYSFDNVGGAPNVVPEKATLWCVGRMGNADEIKELKRKVDNCADGIALATETEVTKELITIIHEKLPNETISSAMHRNFKFVGKPDFPREVQESAAQIQQNMGLPPEKMGKELRPLACSGMPVNDGSEFSWLVPMDTAMIELTPDHMGWHNWIVTKFAGGAAGKTTVSAAAKILACTAVDLVETPGLLDKAKKELTERLNGRIYEPLFDNTNLPGSI